MNLTLLLVVLVVLYALFGSGMMENFWGWGWGYPHHGYYYGAYRYPYRGYGYRGYRRGYRGRPYRGRWGYW